MLKFLNESGIVGNDSFWTGFDVCAGHIIDVNYNYCQFNEGKSYPDNN